MSNELYYVEFKGTPADGVGPITEPDHKGWFKFDMVAGGDGFRDISDTKVGVGNQTDNNPIHISDIYMSADHCSAAGYLHQMLLKSSVIKQITIHRVYSDQNKLTKDEEMIVTNARIKSFSNVNNFTEVSFSGFDTFERCYYLKLPNGEVKPNRVGIDLATGAGKQ